MIQFVYKNNARVALAITETMVHEILPLGRRDPAKLYDGLANERIVKVLSDCE